jgi:hypothetical protein
VELVVPVSVLVELGGIIQGFDWEGPKLKEPFLILGKTPEAGETMSVQDFPFERYQAFVKATASPLRCLPPEEVVDDRKMVTTIHDHQVRPFRCSVGDDWARSRGVSPKVP